MDIPVDKVVTYGPWAIAFALLLLAVVNVAKYWIDRNAGKNPSSGDLLTLANHSKSVMELTVAIGKQTVVLETVARAVEKGQDQLALEQRKQGEVLQRIDFRTDQMAQQVNHVAALVQGGAQAGA